MTSVTGYSDLRIGQDSLSSAEQPALPHIGGQPAVGKRAFIRSPLNEAALKLLEGWRADFRAGAMGGVLIIGAAGAGKTYLAEYVTAPLNPLILDGRQTLPAMDDLPEASLLVFDNVDQISDPDHLLRFVGHCLERMRAFMVVGRGKPSEWAKSAEGPLADLETRLAALPLAILEKPDEALLADVLIQLLAERQIRIDRNVAGAAVAKLKRSFTALTAFADQLDQTALRRQKTIDRTFVQDVLKGMPEHALI